MEKKVRSDAVYNHWDNMIYVRTNGNTIHIICHKEEQMESVNKRFYGSGNELIGYEEWDEGEDKKWIMTWKILNEEEPPLKYN